jgi:hypothetical protein
MDGSPEFETFEGRVRALRHRRRRVWMGAIAIAAAGVAVGVVSQLLRERPSTGALACHNSYDKRCGPFRWDPQPDKQPLTVQISTRSGTAKVGEPVTFHVVVDDPDWHIDRSCQDDDFGDEGQDCEDQCAAATSQPYGPWSPPPKNPDHYETDITHTYKRPGAYAVKVTFRSGTCGPPTNPYGSRGTGTIQVTMTA